MGVLTEYVSKLERSKEEREKMKAKTKTDTNHSKNHLGNYGISVSFDMFGDCSDDDGNILVDRLDEKVKRAFNQWCLEVEKDTNIRIKNIVWDQGE